MPKAAAIALSETMKAELRRYGIGVIVSCLAAFTSESVAAHAIRGMERGRLYDIARDSLEVLWFVKRLMPETIYRVFAWMYANRKWRFKDA